MNVNVQMIVMISWWCAAEGEGESGFAAVSVARARSLESQRD
jgi:hypothetical protein